MCGSTSVYVLTLISWVIQKRSIVSIYENGIRYKKFSGSWVEIESARVVEEGSGRKHIKLRKSKLENVVIPSSIEGFDRILGVVIEKTSS
jgi:hypothetical protein